MVPGKAEEEGTVNGWAGDLRFCALVVDGEFQYPLKYGITKAYFTQFGGHLLVDSAVSEADRAAYTQLYNGALVKELKRMDYWKKVEVRLKELA